MRQRGAVEIRRRTRVQLLDRSPSAAQTVPRCRRSRCRCRACRGGCSSSAFMDARCDKQKAFAHHVPCHLAACAQPPPQTVLLCHMHLIPSTRHPPTPPPPTPGGPSSAHIDAHGWVGNPRRAGPPAQGGQGPALAARGPAEKAPPAAKPRGTPACKLHPNKAAQEPAIMAGWHEHRGEPSVPPERAGGAWHQATLAHTRASNATSSERMVAATWEQGSLRQLTRRKCRG